MTLDILIPHYNEPENIIKPLLDSIESQQGIDFSKIKVIIVNDGDKLILSDTFLKNYTFNLQYIIKDHEGVSAARNKALELSQADFVMFCDADDMFTDCTALWQILTTLTVDTDIFKAVFTAELLLTDPQINKVLYADLINNKDITSIFHLILPKSLKILGLLDTFVHGKIFRRQFLVDNNIKYPVGLGYAEDGYFCKLALCLSKKTVYYNKSFYLWRYNKGSVTRINQTIDIELDHFKAILQSSQLLIQEISNRNLDVLAQTSALSNIYFSVLQIMLARNTELEAKLKNIFYPFYLYCRQFDTDKISFSQKINILDTLKKELNQFPQLELITVSDIELWLKNLKEPE